MVKNVLLPGKEVQCKNIPNLKLLLLRAQEINPGSDSFPTDWSLKLKARFTSVHPFSWGSVMSSIEEASGITNFTRCSADENLKIKVNVLTVFKSGVTFCCMADSRPTLVHITTVFDAVDSSGHCLEYHKS